VTYFNRKCVKQPSHNSTCFVPGCCSGYRAHKGYSLFQPPQDDILLANWQRAIPRADRILTARDRVCEKHFEAGMIERTYKVVIGDKVKELERGKPRLVDGAIPTIFPNLPKYLSKQPVRKRKDRKLPAAEPHPKKHRASVQGEAIEVDDSFSNVLPIEDLSFNLLCQTHVKYCPPEWISTCNSSHVSFGQISIENGQMMVVLSVNIDVNLNVSVYHRTRHVVGLIPQQLTSALHLDQIFATILKARSCPGNPDSQYHSSLTSSRVGVLEENSTWRHVNCVRLISNGKRCMHCRKLRRMLQTALKRRVSRRKRLRKRPVSRLQKRVQMFRLLTARLKKALTNAKQTP